MLKDQKVGWCWQEPNRVEGEEGRGRAVGASQTTAPGLNFILRPQEVFGGLQAGVSGSDSAFLKYHWDVL